MKRSIGHTSLAFGTVVALVLSVCVACQRSGEFATLGDGGGGGGGTGTPKTTLPQGPLTSIQASVPSQITTCFGLSNKSLAVYNECYAAVDDADQVSDGCDGAVADLANTLCDGLQARISTAKSACGSILSQRGALPSACQNAINSLM